MTCHLKGPYIYIPRRGLTTGGSMPTTNKRRTGVSFTREQLNFLMDKFPRHIRYPGTSIDQLMFDNGVQEVLSVVRSNTATLTSLEIAHDG